MSLPTHIFWKDGLAFCSACQELLSTEEIDWECCDACGGEGFDEDAEEDGWWPSDDEPTSPSPDASSPAQEGGE